MVAKEEEHLEHFYQYLHGLLQTQLMARKGVLHNYLRVICIKARLSCSIFHLIKCKVVIQPAGGRCGKGSRLIQLLSAQGCDSCKALPELPSPRGVHSGLSHHSEVISGCNVCVQSTPARKPSAFCQKQKQPRWC